MPTYTLVDGKKYLVADDGTLVPVGKAASVMAGTPDPNSPWGPMTPPSDIAEQQRQGWKEAGTVAAIGGGASALQTALLAAPTASDKYAKENLASLARHKGLTRGQRADIDEQAMRGVRALAAESQQQDEAILSGAQTHSAAAIQNARKVNADAVNKAAIEAADIGIRENRAQYQRDVEKEAQLTEYQSRRRSEIFDKIGATVGELAETFGPVLAQQPSMRGPTEAEFTQWQGQKNPDGSPLYPGIQGISYADYSRSYADELRNVRRAENPLRRDASAFR